MKELTKKYANVTDMLADGFTVEDIKALAEGPRTKPAEWDEEHTYFKWPYINGIATTGLFSLLTREEKDAYNLYHKKHASNGTGSTRSKMSDEDKKDFEALKEALKDNKEAMTILLRIESRLGPKNSLLEEIFGVTTIAALQTKVTKTWVMYRGKDGTRGKNPETFTIKDAIKEFGDDFNCVMTASQLEEKVNKLKSKGIDVTACFVD